MARVPKMARGKISFARGLHCCPIFFLLSDKRLYIMKNMSIYTYLTTYRLYVNYRCYQITPRVKHFYTNRERCEVLTGYLSLGRRSWRIRDIGQNVLRSSF